MPLYCHYTDEKCANNIVRDGKIRASLTFMAGGDAGAGNGVYLTQMKPGGNSKSEIAMNNWKNTHEKFIKKTQNYFVLDLPKSEVNEVMDSKRNIFIYGHGNDLRLKKYPWWLKDWDSGRILASYKYHVGSFGPASTMCSELMGDYVMTEDTVNGRPVYKGANADMYMSSEGMWFIGECVEDSDFGWLVQDSKYSLGPTVTLPWEYMDQSIEEWNADDDTLRVHPWQK